MSAAADKCEFVVQTPVTGTIAKVGFRTGTVTTGDTLKIGIYTVDAATGNATSTLYGSSTTTTVVIADANDNVWFLADIGDATGATSGDFVAVVLEFNSYVAGNLNISTADGSNHAALLPYTGRFTAAAWAKTVNAPMVTFEYSGGTYHPISGAFPAAVLNDESYHSGSTPDERGNKLTLPFKCRAVGVWFYGDTNADVSIKLYDTDGSTVLASVTYDPNVQQAATLGIKYVRFAAAVILNAGSAYRLTVLPADTTSSALGSLDVDSTVGVAMMDALPGGQNVHYTARTDAGAWSQTTTRRAMIGLLLDQVDDGAAGGGTVVH